MLSQKCMVPQSCRPNPHSSNCEPPPRPPLPAGSTYRSRRLQSITSISHRRATILPTCSNAAAGLQKHEPFSKRRLRTSKRSLDRMQVHSGDAAFWQGCIGLSEKRLLGSTKKRSLKMPCAKPNRSKKADLEEAASAALDLVREGADSAGDVDVSPLLRKQQIPEELAGNRRGRCVIAAVGGDGTFKVDRD